MTTSNVPNWQKNNQDSSDTYAWIIVAIFIALILCVSIIFCGLGFWIIRSNGISDLQPEVETASEPKVDILQTISVDPQWKLLINDEFNNNQNDWEIGPYQSDSLTLDRTIKEGKYVWDYESKAGWYFWVFPDSNTVQDFVATVEIKHLEGNLNEEFGLIIRAYDDKYYLLEMAENGRISFVISDNDQETTLMERSISTVKVGESNQITVQAQGNHFAFYVNGHLVDEIDDDRLTRGYIGILTSTDGRPKSIFDNDSDNPEQYYPSKFEVDNFKIWVPITGYTKLETLTPEAGRIVFVSDKDGNPEIYSINTDGVDPDRLTNNTADDHSPQWSPDGSQIAFVSTRDGNPEIYIMNANGTGITRITHNPSEDLDPAWSPDGKKIVYSSNRDDNYEIYTHNLETGEAERLTENISEDRHPDWSSKDGLIFYKSTQYGSVTLYALQVSTKESTRVELRIPPNGMSRPVFSVDGLKVVYETGIAKDKTGIILYDLDKKQSVELAGKNEANLSPAWSPTGRQIAFVTKRDGQTDIYIISDNAAEIFRVTNTEANEWDLDWTEK